MSFASIIWESDVEIELISYTKIMKDKKSCNLRFNRILLSTKQIHGQAQTQQDALLRKIQVTFQSSLVITKQHYLP